MRAFFAIGFSMLAGCGGGLCDATELSAALEGASAGQRVELGECRIVLPGSLTVPSGVTLAGQARGASALEVGGSTNTASLILEPGANTRLEDLSLFSLGALGILSDGSGTESVGLARVEVSVTSGSGAGFAELASVALDDVVISSAPAAQGLGLIFIRVNAATLQSARVSGFGFGAVFAGGSAVWNGGGAERAAITGVYGQAAEVQLTDVVLDQNGQPALSIGYGAAFTRGSTLTTTNVHVSRTVGIGIIHDLGTTGRHTGLIADANLGAGVWAQSRSAIDVGGTFDMNSRGAIVGYDTRRVNVRDSRIERTNPVLHIPPGSVDAVMIGDGVHVAGSPSTSISLADLILTDNGRTGVLIDLAGGTLAAGAVGAITVTAPSGNGVIAQNGSITMGWDASVMRGGATATNDAQLTSRLETLSSVGPCYMPVRDPMSAGLLGSVR